MSLPHLHGRVAWIFEEDNYDIDLIVGIKNIKLTNIDELAAVTMSSYDKDFGSAVQKGDLLVGGHNFGYGHPHYPAMRAMRHLGIAGVIAESFSPGFFRGEISMGFPLVTCPGIRAAVSRWDTLSVDWELGQVRNAANGQALPMEPLSSVERATLAAGGFIPYLKARLAKQAPAGHA
ncbi:3-isopropylmalate dehydratase [Lampropedia aestuarii]|uniref:3-isopropylmalate dehydratase n=1 Tax=Lampropedia aestuarii TaxID=2562762 RepID=UPI002468E3DC|nr:3-isopropylmalate dehydratase [Lampropedia aestuarii]MDH5858015.1 3-isopropylmalate dehydratase [Lampropedia aestuarii]